MRQILLFAALAASLTLLSGCALSIAKKDTEDMPDKAAEYSCIGGRLCVRYYFLRHLPPRLRC